MSQTPPHSSVDRSERAGSPGLVLLLAAALLAIVAFFSLLGREQSPRFILVLLAFLAFTGVSALLAYAVGFLQLAGAHARNDVTKAISDTSPDGMIVTEGESRIVYANETYLALCGASDESGLRTVDRLFFGAPEAAEPLYRLAQAARDGKRGAEELRLTPPLLGDGEFGWYRIRVRPIDRPSSPPAALWTISDVTRERERHENIFQELQHAIDFLDHAPAGFFSTEPNGEISYMNATLASWLDFDLAQVGSGGLALRDIVADDAAAMLSSGPGAPNLVRTEQIDLDLRRRDNRRLPVRLLHRIAYGHDGAPGASRTLALNRAPGEEPAEEARAAEVRFARFFNSTPMAIASVDRDGAILRSNAAFARLMPGALQDAAGRRLVANGVAAAHREALRAAVAAVASGAEASDPIDAALQGSSRSARLFVTSNEEDNERGALVFALDTTEERNREEQLHQSQKMQAVGQLAGGIAHDFNNVLTAIIGYSELLLANHRPTDPSFQDIMQIKQNANRAAGLVRQLLAFSRRQTLRPQVLQLGDVLSELQMLTRRLVGEKIEVDLRQGRDLWLVKADLNQFEQVIVNLIVNARDAMPDGGKIFLRTKNVPAAECESYGEKLLIPADYVLIEVEDTGSGIPPDILGKIFDPFFTTKETGKGTGLGLSMVYGIVKQTGGFIFPYSQVGRGTIFRIFLNRYIPIDEPEEAPKAEEEKPKAAADHTGRGVVLLVEDEEAVRAFGARALASRGYTVLEADSGLDALRVVEETTERIDLIVSDVVMPEMDGPTMFAELRKRGVKAKVVFVSGYAEEAFAKNLPEGEFGFLPKPFTLKQLIETVKENMRA